ncbi:sensor histidine kinase [Ruania zhangjianzhongii]|uniref:sensor histidine kinase n=1 Tax=Ruania zhangjianzhongii TaxID=2603206 RepID=UPI0011CBC6F4|nr:histidine kinase [Ruania zhangjianzhongii]
MTSPEETVLDRGTRAEEGSRNRRWSADLLRAALAPFVGVEHWGPLAWWARILCAVPALLALGLAVVTQQPNEPPVLNIAWVVAGAAWLLTGWRPRYGWWLAAALNAALALAAVTGLPLADPSIWSASALVGSTAVLLVRAPALPRRVAAGYALVLLLVGPHGLDRIVWPLLVVLLTLSIDASRSKRAEQARADAALLSADEARAEARSARDRELLAQERARIARDLHDVVAHHMSLIVVRADTASYRLTGLDPPARTEFRDLAEEARTALQEVRGVLTVLHDGGAPLAPQPGLAQVPALIVAARGAGTTVHEDLPDPLPELPARCGIAAYRVIQESLSNARRHAPDQDVHVTVAEQTVSGQEFLHVQVHNAVTGQPRAEGHGLRGLAEQARAAGGSLTLTSDGRVFRVEARLPMRTQQ